MDISTGDLRPVFQALGKNFIQFFIYSIKVVWNGGFMVVLHGTESNFSFICSLCCYFERIIVIYVADVFIMYTDVYKHSKFQFACA